MCIVQHLICVFRLYSERSWKHCQTSIVIHLYIFIKADHRFIDTSKSQIIFTLQGGAFETCYLNFLLMIIEKKHPTNNLVSLIFLSVEAKKRYEGRIYFSYIFFIHILKQRVKKNTMTCVWRWSQDCPSSTAIDNLQILVNTLTSTSI